MKRKEARRGLLGRMPVAFAPIRCKDCEWYAPQNGNHRGACTVRGDAGWFSTPTDGFCHLAVKAGKR